MNVGNVVNYKNHLLLFSEYQRLKLKWISDNRTLKYLNHILVVKFKSFKRYFRSSIGGTYKIERSIIRSSFKETFAHEFLIIEQ